MLRNWLLLFLGGGLGAVLREALVLVVAAPLAGEGIDFLPIFVANMTAAFLIGLVTSFAVNGGILGADGKLFLATGMMGGLSTFSSLIWGTESAFSDPATRSISIFYLVATMILGFLLVKAGLWLGQRVVSKRIAT